MSTAALTRSGERSFALAAELPALAGVAVLLAGVYAAFFGRYAFDDSYVGYSIAQSLLSGNGFTFNHTDHVISTSAPLAPPLYALFSLIFHAGIVQVAQVFSALAAAVVGFGSYALARRFSSPAGAFVAAAVMLCSPFTLLLWSHETLLYLAVSIVALNLFAARRYDAAAGIAGVATLFRAEALLVLPFLWAARWKESGWAAGLRFACLSVLAYALWIAIAWHLFGSFASQTIASKHAQLLFYPAYPMLLGTLAYFVYSFSFNISMIFAQAMAVSLAAAACAAYVNRVIRPAYWAVAAWFVVTMALYVGLGVQLYFWFTIQCGVLSAVVVMSLWPVEQTGARTKALAIGRIGGALYCAGCIAFLCVQIQRGAVLDRYWNPPVMPELHHNAYYSLGKWFAAHAAPGDRIAYQEFGQLHYYSGHDVIDYLGIVSSGAARELARNDAIWTFKKFTPQWFVDVPRWHVFVNPLEYDWFRSAYRFDTRLRYPWSEAPNDFGIYRLTQPRFIPPPDTPVALAPRVWTSRSGALHVAFTVRATPLVAVEERARLGSDCRAVTLRLFRGSRLVAQRSEAVSAGEIERLTLRVPHPAPGSYRYDLSGCTLVPAPPILLRPRAPIFFVPPVERGTARDAFVAYT